MTFALGRMIAISFFALLQMGAAAAQDSFPARIALVIGNGDYPDSDRLVNPVNDAQDIGAALRSVGFEADVHVNLDQREFGRAVDRFVTKLRSRPGALALFYFAGHGTQRGGEHSDNLLWPAGERPEDSESSAQRLNLVLSRMHDAGAAAKVVILDACRTTREGARGGARGLAVYDGRIDALIAYAAAAGQIADDNPRERNGLYTKYLLGHLGTGGLSMYQILSRTAESVRKSRPQGQLPELRSLAADIRLSEVPLSPGRLPEEAAALWSALQGGDDCEFESYLRRFPNGPMSAEARRRLEACRQGRARDSAAAAPSSPSAAPAAVQDQARFQGARNNDQLGKIDQPMPGRWKSLDSGFTRTIRVDGDFMYVEADPPEPQRRAGAFGLSDLKRQGNRYVGTYTHAEARIRNNYGREEVKLCRYATEQELTLVSPTRIEGRTNMPSYILDWNTCTFPPKVWKDFTWIPVN